MHFVKKAKYLWDYKVRLTFEDWVKKTTNLQKYVWKWFVFWPLENKDFFKTLKVENDTITWETGADFSPDMLYDIGE